MIKNRKHFNCLVEIFCLFKNHETEIFRHLNLLSKQSFNFETFVAEILMFIVPLQFLKMNAGVFFCHSDSFSTIIEQAITQWKPQSLILLLKSFVSLKNMKHGHLFKIVEWNFKTLNSFFKQQNSPFDRLTNKIWCSHVTQTNFEAS